MNKELTIGAMAPDFKLKTKSPGADIKEIKLSDNFGKRPTVLLFVPLAFTGTCTKTFCAISQETNWAQIQKTGAAIYGISIDSPFTLEAWSREQNITFPLLSDFNRTVAPQYGVLADVGDFKDVCWRAAFVISTEGKIVYAWKAPKDNIQEFPPLEEVSKVVEKELTMLA